MTNHKDNVQPYCPQDNLRGILSSVFAKWKTQLPKTEEIASHLPDDFDKKIKKILLAADIQTRVQNPLKSALGGKPFWDGISFVHTPHNLLSIAERLGIAVERTSQFCYVRDSSLRLADHSLVTPYSSKNLQQATLRTHSSNLYCSRTAASHTANQFFNIWSGQTRSYVARAKMLSYTYIEGGNVYIVTNKRGERKALVGVDHLVQTFHMLELEGRSWHDLSKIAFPNKTYEKLQGQIVSQLKPGEIEAAAREMFAQDLLQHNGKSGLITHKNQLDFMLMKFFAYGKFKESVRLHDVLYKIALEKGIINAFEYQASDQRVAVDYLTKIHIVKGLLAKELGVRYGDLHFVTQVNYHLDLFITPGPSHSLFVTNYAMCVDLLEAMKGLQLSQTDLHHLERYIVTAKKLDSELGGLLKEVETELQQAGFDVVRAPGNFMYESATMYSEFPMPSGGFNINFMNALTGRSDAGAQYYITHGAQAGDNLGKMLMGAFCLFLKQYVPQIEVYYIGQSPDNDFSEAMDWWNRLETQSGIHCTTLELEWS
ncbi:MAG: hypothetical protein JSR46_07190 [Verrucomicrobia bacterium]|nr:hypothetical protein [Verrucomicrobiota bacterium]